MTDETVARGGEPTFEAEKTPDKLIQHGRVLTCCRHDMIRCGEIMGRKRPESHVAAVAVRSAFKNAIETDARGEFEDRTVRRLPMDGRQFGADGKLPQEEVGIINRRQLMPIASPIIGLP